MLGNSYQSILAFDKPYDAIYHHHKSTENAKIRLSIRPDRYICWNVIQEKSWNHYDILTLHHGLRIHIVSHNYIETSKSTSSYNKLTWNWMTTLKLYCMINFEINSLSTYTLIFTLQLTSCTFAILFGFCNSHFLSAL